MKVLSKSEVRNRVLYNPAHIDRLERADQFPKRIRLGTNRVRWIESEIDEWIQEHIDVHDPPCNSKYTKCPKESYIPTVLNLLHRKIDTSTPSKTWASNNFGLEGSVKW